MQIVGHLLTKYSKETTGVLSTDDELDLLQIPSQHYHEGRLCPCRNLDARDNERGDCYLSSLDMHA